MASQSGSQTIVIHILYLEKQRQSQNEIWSVKRMQHEKQFF